MNGTLRTSLTLVTLALCIRALSASAQGAGATGAQVMQFVAGSRAPAFSGAYTAASGDADALFYNPAGAAVMRQGAALSYERYVEDIALGSFGAVLGFGRWTFGLGAIHLDSGKIDELEPDPEFGGNIGIPTGRTVSAGETVARVSVAAPFGDRLRFGASAGLVSAQIADLSSSAPVFDLGAQYELPHVTLGAALRNIGGALAGDDLADAELPTEARFGAAALIARADGLGVTVHTDLVARLREGSAGLIVGAEAGWLPRENGAVGAVGRIGYSTAEGDGGLGALKFGAGISMARLALDYTYQNLEFLGAVHRLGLRWSILR